MSIKKFNYVYLLFVVVATMFMSVAVYASDDHFGWKAVKQLSDISTLTTLEGYYKISPGDYYLNDILSFNKTFVVDEGTVNLCLHSCSLTIGGMLESVIVRNGATLNIVDCGAENGKLINSRDSQSATCVLCTGNSKVNISGGSLISEGGISVCVNGGQFTLNNGLVKGARTAIKLMSGNVRITGGKVDGRKDYGILAENSSKSEGKVEILGGDIAGLSGAVYSMTGSNMTLQMNIYDGNFTGSVKSQPVIDVRAKDNLNIEGGYFFGSFPQGMNAKISGGYFSNDSASNYVVDGYMFKSYGSSKYPFTVQKKREYKVVFTDGNGNTLKTQTLYEGEHPVPPKTPERKGYKFDGWDLNCNTITYSDTVITINATWVESKDGDNGNGNETTTATIPKPKKVKLKAGKKKIVVTWKKLSGTALEKFDKYEIEYSRKKYFTKSKKVYVNKKSGRKVIKKLSSKKRYYVRIRKCKNDGSVSKWVTKTVVVK